MIHVVIPVGPLQCNCSIVGDEESREPIVIDPGDDVEQLMDVVRKHNLTVKQIAVTHAHIDHVGGAMKLKALTGAPVLLNQNDTELLKMLPVQAGWIGVPPPGPVTIDDPLRDGDTLRVGARAATDRKSTRL